jgi:hypothetical protein
LADRVLTRLFVARSFEFNDYDWVACALTAKSKGIEKYDIRLIFGGSLPCNGADSFVGCKEVVTGKAVDLLPLNAPRFG